MRRPAREVNDSAGFSIACVHRSASRPRAADLLARCAAAGFADAAAQVSTIEENQY
jgi:hypothetical protein